MAQLSYLGEKVISGVPVVGYNIGLPTRHLAVKKLLV
jgi:hypothetical protein